MIKFLWIIFFMMGITVPASGSEYSFNLNMANNDNLVMITVQNTSPDSVLFKNIDVELDGKIYKLLKQDANLASGAESFFSASVDYPMLPGTYPLIANLRFYNDDKVVSFLHVDRYHHRQQAPLDENCRISNVNLTGTGEIVVKSVRPEIWRLLVPEEITIISEKVFSDKKVFIIKSTTEGLNKVYPYFAVAEQATGGVNRTAIFRGAIEVRSSVAANYTKGRISSSILVAFLILFVVVYPFFCVAGVKNERILLTLHKYVSRMILITVSYLLWKNADVLVGFTLKFIEVPSYRDSADILIRYFNSMDFVNFFTYFIDAYFLGCMILLFPYLYLFEFSTPLNDDKYSSLITCIVSIIKFHKAKQIYWDYTSRLGLLTVCMKNFFIPFVVSWEINSVTSLFKWVNNFSFDFRTVNAGLVELLIFVDISIFCFGYLVESDRLKSTIKSVEPTVLGWVVCLWCYPPFNMYSFRIFDHKLIDLGYTWPVWVVTTVTLLITFLWGIYTWASVALGWKASNLTNRGIVIHGPYRFVRHPAYISKLLIFYLSGIFFVPYVSGLLIGFTLIYALRAWTEERHLSADPDYLAYKETVRWQFIPGVI